jgi:hypothetical protein
MKPNSRTDAARAVTAERDDGRHAARVVMLSTLLLFSFIFLLLAIAP